MLQKPRTALFVRYAIDFFRHKPATDLLREHEENEAYCLPIPGEEYAVYFPGKGEVWLDPGQGEFEIRWLQIRSSTWGVAATATGPLRLNTPTDDQWAVLIRRLD